MLWFVANGLVPQSPNKYPAEHLTAEYSKRRQERHERYALNSWDVNDMRGYLFCIQNRFPYDPRTKRHVEVGEGGRLFIDLLYNVVDDSQTTLPAYPPESIEMFLEMFRTGGAGPVAFKHRIVR